MTRMHVALSNNTLVHCCMVCTECVPRRQQLDVSPHQCGGPLKNRRIKGYSGSFGRTRQERSESAREQRTALYKNAINNSNNQTKMRNLHIKTKPIAIACDEDTLMSFIREVLTPIHVSVWFIVIVRDVIVPSEVQLSSYFSIII